MKRFISLLFALTGLAAKAYGQIDFSNTSFSGVTTGQSWTIYWADGNGEAVSLALVNSTWSYPIFSEQLESPMYYTWNIPSPPGFVTGNYQLQLAQDAGGDPTLSPAFAVTVAPPPSTTSTTAASTSNITSSTTSGVPFVGPTVTSTVTVEYIFFDVGCGCTKSTSGPAPLGTAVAATTTYTYFEDECGCTKSTVIPVSTVAANYTAPLSPPVPFTSASATPSPVATAFAGAADKKEVSFLGLVVMIAAAFML